MLDLVRSRQTQPHQPGNVFFVIVCKAGNFAHRQIQGRQHIQANLRHTHVQCDGIVQIVLMHQCKCGVVVGVEIKQLACSVLQAHVNHQVARQKHPAAKLGIHVRRDTASRVQMHSHPTSQKHLERALQRKSLFQLPEKCLQPLRQGCMHVKWGRGAHQRQAPCAPSLRPSMSRKRGKLGTQPLPTTSVAASCSPGCAEKYCSLARSRH